MKYVVTNGEMEEKEVMQYAKIISSKHYNIPLKSLKLTIKSDEEGEYVDCEYELKDVPFERIRRITGYLVGTMDRWNNGKKAEEHDRVKHGVY